MINAAFTFVSKFPNLTTVSGTSLWYIQSEEGRDNGEWFQYGDSWSRMDCALFLMAESSAVSFTVSMRLK